MNLTRCYRIVSALATTLIAAGCSSNPSEADFLPQKWRIADSLQYEGDKEQSFQLLNELYAENTDPRVTPFIDYLKAWLYCTGTDDDSVHYYATRALNTFSQYNLDSAKWNRKRIADIELLLGYSSIQLSPDSALYHFKRATSLYQRMGNVRKMVDSNVYIAEIYRNRYDYVNSLMFLRDIEQICDTMSITSPKNSWTLNILSEVANLLTEIGDYRQANNYLHTATLYFDISDSESMQNYMYQRVRTHFFQNEYTLAAASAKKLHDLALANKDYENLSKAYIMMGLSKSRLNENDEAQAYKLKADSLREAHNLQEIKEKLMLDGEIAAKNHKLDLAHELLFDAPAKDIRAFNYVSLLESQKAYYLERNDYKEIYRIQNEQKRFTDSIQTTVIYANENMRLESNRFSANTMRRELRQAQSDIEALNYERNTERMMFAAAIALAIAYIIIQLKSNARNHKKALDHEYQRLENEIQNKVMQLEKQKEMLMITNNRISESISYAERIQHSIIPHPGELNSYPISGSFIFHSPLDIVSGDFYWFTKKGDTLIVCCADCTGHGIPGAFMSMIATTILNDICNKADDDIKPSEILERMDAMIIENLTHNNNEPDPVKDGLDISIVSINLNTYETTIGAARRPVIVIKDNDILTIKGTKRSIGDTEPIIRERKFTDTTIKLHKDDVIYMYTDGYNDQFGGQDGGKMKNQKIKKFLRAIHDDDMDEQCLTVQELFTQWKSDYPQTDDVLFIGIKL